MGRAARRHHGGSTADRAESPAEVAQSIAQALHYLEAEARRFGLADLARIIHHAAAAAVDDGGAAPSAASPSPPP